MFRRLLPIISMSLLLAGCALPGSVAVPTPYPPEYLPTVIYLTAESIHATVQAGITPTETPTVTPTVPATLTPTPAPTLTPTTGPGAPLAAIQISAPGPMSRIVSPVEVHASVQVRDGYKVETALYDESGQVISRPALTSYIQAGTYPVSLKIPFGVRAAQTGIVLMDIRDPHGRLLSVISMHVLLLSEGTSQVNPAGNLIYERAVLYDLPADAAVTGGTLAVQGRFEPLNKKPVILELRGDDGTLLVQRVLNLDNAGPQEFTTTLPYKVDQATAARLFIYQDDDLIQGPAYLYSQPIQLDP